MAEQKIAYDEPVPYAAKMAAIVGIALFCLFMAGLAGERMGRQANTGWILTDKTPPPLDTAVYGLYFEDKDGDGFPDVRAVSRAREDGSLWLEGKAAMLLAADPVERPPHWLPIPPHAEVKP